MAKSLLLVSLLTVAGESAGPLPQSNGPTAPAGAALTCEQGALKQARRSWEKEHPRPSESSDVAAQAAHRREQHEFFVNMTRQCPQRAEGWSGRLDTIAGIRDLHADEIEATADGLLAASGDAEKPKAAERIAHIYLDRNVRVERVPGLLERPALAAGADSSPADRLQQWRTDWLLARAENKLGRVKERDVLVARLVESRPTDVEPFIKKMLEMQYSILRAEMAAQAGRWADAFALYQSVFAETRFAPVGWAGEDAWKKLGGSSEGLRLLAGASVASPGWVAVERPAPPVIRDAVKSSGGQASSRPRRTFVNFWATSCSPCLEELPHVQNLYEAVKGRSDVAVITVNVDEVPAVVPPFMKRRAYTFPVTMAGDLSAWVPALPTSWVVDEKGIVRSESMGFAPSSSEHWVRDALAQLERK